MHQRIVACQWCLTLYWTPISGGHASVCDNCGRHNEMPDHIQTIPTNVLVNEALRRAPDRVGREEVIDSLKEAHRGADADKLPDWVRRIIPKDQANWIALLALGVALLSLVRDVADDDSAQIARILRERLPDTEGPNSNRALRLASGEVVVQHVESVSRFVRDSLTLHLAPPVADLRSLNFYGVIGGEGGPFGWPNGGGSLGSIWKFSEVKSHLRSGREEFEATLTKSSNGETGANGIGRLVLRNTAGQDVWLVLVEKRVRGSLEHRDAKVNPVEEIPGWSLKLDVDGTPYTY